MSRLIIAQIGLKEDETEENTVEPFISLESDLEGLIDDESLKKFENAVIDFCESVFNNIKNEEIEK